ncbi:MAG TPA: DUF530 domain-containing protein [Euryarchaeota archaeon]|nr:hypothetical protein BMS3Bbin15_01857 [archaeon BMS3Bbin15]HDL15078.1 DUF530 domain-containing protein [Euryarchaeota archaeon]
MKDEDTIPLITRATELLDEISSTFRVNLDSLKKDKRYFEELYLNLKHNLEELKRLKDEMEQRGFDSPYFALGLNRFGSPFEKGSYRREDVEDQRDVARHKMFFRTTAAYKKGTFERTKGAIAAHNIAIGHLEEFVSFKCSCGKEAKGKDATRIIEERGRFVCTKCRSREISLVPNEQGIYRLEILPYLTYGGEFTVDIANFTPTERMAYRELVEIAREKKKGKIKSATVTFKASKNDKWVTMREQVEVGKEGKLDYEGYLRAKYGRIVVEHVRYHHERSILVSGRYNRQALAIAYTKILKYSRDEILDYLLSKRVDVKKLREYEELKRKFNARLYNAETTPAYAIDTRIIEEREELMHEFDEELKARGLMDEYGSLINTLDIAISYRQEIRKNMLIRIPKAIFGWDIFKFLLIKPYRERRYASIFPGLQPIPEEDQLEQALSILAEADLLYAIRKFIDPKVVPVKDAYKIVFKKFDIEDILQDYLKVTSSRAVGGIALYLYSDFMLEAASEVVAAEPKDLKEVLKVVIRLGRRDIIPEEKLEGMDDIKYIKISEKAKQFLELVR